MYCTDLETGIVLFSSYDLEELIKYPDSIRLNESILLIKLTNRDINKLFGRDELYRLVITKDIRVPVYHDGKQVSEMIKFSGIIGGLVSGPHNIDLSNGSIVWIEGNVFDNAVVSNGFVPINVSINENAIVNLNYNGIDNVVVSKNIKLDLKNDIKSVPYSFYNELTNGYATLTGDRDILYIAGPAGVGYGNGITLFKGDYATRDLFEYVFNKIKDNNDLRDTNKMSEKEMVLNTKAIVTLAETYFKKDGE